MIKEGEFIHYFGIVNSHVIYQPYKYNHINVIKQPLFFHDYDNIVEDYEFLNEINSENHSLYGVLRLKSIKIPNNNIYWSKFSEMFKIYTNSFFDLFEINKQNISLTNLTIVWNKEEENN